MGAPFLVLVLSILTGCAIPTRMINPVLGADTASWNPITFWYHPWGSSVVHKGIDIFKPVGTPILAPQSGFIYWRSHNGKGGNHIYMLGPLLRLHYFAHLESFDKRDGRWVSKGDTIGYLGTTGNAAGKTPHLHYHIITLVPYPWRITRERHGLRKMFYLDPGEKIKSGARKDPS